MSYSPPTPNHFSAPPALLLAAPASGSGKTTLTLGLLRALRRAGVAVASAKVGPDYIDPAFHHAAGGRVCHNVDLWAMRSSTLAAQIARGDDAELLLIEGVMGLFDGSVGGGAHATLLRRACEPLGLPVLGCVPRDAALRLPSRHLGLIQAREHTALNTFIDAAADRVAAAVDLSALQKLARPANAVLNQDRSPKAGAPGPAPLGRRVAVARDDAFAFSYDFILDAWQSAGTELTLFSPLADEAPADNADAVYLPGGYPELHAGRLAANRRFLDGLRAAARRGAAVYGECGGYMTLGEILTDGDGIEHTMAGLLPVATSFAAPRLHLGYRQLKLRDDGPLGTAGLRLRGHEFHYATLLRNDAPALFEAAAADGRKLDDMGSRVGSVCGSFAHWVDRV